METISYSLEVGAPGGTMPLWVAEPAGDGLYPAILVLMEAFGLNAHIRSVCKRLAAEGYVAAAPDLYYREAERTVAYSNTDRAVGYVMRTIALSDSPEERVKDERVMADVAAAVQALAAGRKVADDRIGALGFDMGARLAFLTLCRLPEQVRGGVAFYGDRIVPVLDEAKSLQSPLLLLFAGRDAAIPRFHVDRIQAELAHLAKPHALHVYPDADHGFFCDERPGHDPAAARDAWAKTLAWFEKSLA